LLSRFSLLSISSTIFVANSPPSQGKLLSNLLIKSLLFLAFTTTFQPQIGRLPCRTKSKFYIANMTKTGTATAALMDENHAERPCKQNAAQCMA
jgi:hypothetical protein